MEKGLLHRLVGAVRSLQAINGIYRFFKGRVTLIRRQFKAEAVKPPKGLTTKKMGRAFMELVLERYPSADKVLSKAKDLEIDHSTQSKIIIFSQFRDAIREVALSEIFSSVQQRDELLAAVLEALEDLEDDLEEELEEEEEE